MKDLYILNSDHHLLTLNSRYANLLAAYNLVEEALKERFIASTERINNPGPSGTEKSWRDFHKKEHAFFVAAAKVRVSTGQMQPSLQPVWEVCQMVRDFDKVAKLEGYEGQAILRSNVLAAEDLYEKGCAVYHEVPVYGSYSSVSALFDAKNDEPREWAVMKAAQGSRLCFHQSDSGDGSKPPPPPHMTKREANLDAWNWCEMAQHDGGMALLYNVRTGQKLSGTNPKSFTNQWGK